LPVRRRVRPNPPRGGFHRPSPTPAPEAEDAFFPPPRSPRGGGGNKGGGDPRRAGLPPPPPSARPPIRCRLDRPEYRGGRRRSRRRPPAPAAPHRGERRPARGGGRQAGTPAPRRPLELRRPAARGRRRGHRAHGARGEPARGRARGLAFTIFVSPAGRTSAFMLKGPHLLAGARAWSDTAIVPRKNYTRCSVRPMSAGGTWRSISWKRAIPNSRTTRPPSCRCCASSGTRR